MSDNRVDNVMGLMISLVMGLLALVGCAATSWTHSNGLVILGLLATVFLIFAGYNAAQLIRE